MLAPSASGYTWSCDCGASGEAPDRDAARTAFKEHKRSHPGLTTSKESESIMANVAKKNGAKGGGGKKQVAKKEKKATTRTASNVTEAQAKAALDRLKKGDTSLIAESKKLGYSHNGPLRAALREMMGAKEYGKFMTERGKPREGGESKPKSAAKKAAAPAKKAAAKTPAKKKPAAKKAAGTKSAASSEDDTGATSAPTPTPSEAATPSPIVPSSAAPVDILPPTSAPETP